MKAIDIVVNPYTPQEVEGGQTGIDAVFQDQIRMPAEMRGGVTVDEYVDKMDRADIELSLMIAVRAGDMRLAGSFEISYERVHEICQSHPTRFAGLAGVDPYRGMQGLRDLEYGGAGATASSAPTSIRTGSSSRPTTPSITPTTPSAASSTCPS